MNIFQSLLLQYLFSILEARDIFCLRFLFTLESYSEFSGINKRGNEDNFDGTHPFPSKVTFQGGRSAIFSRFLSEEWDVDCLSIYLHYREWIQETFEYKFQNLAHFRIWDYSADDNDAEKVNRQRVKILTSNSEAKSGLQKNSIRGSKPRNLKTVQRDETNTILLTRSLDLQKAARTPPLDNDTDMSQTQVGKRKNTRGDHGGNSTEKIVPVDLPPHLQFTEDTNFPESPLVSFKAEALPFVCNKIVSKMTSQ